MSPKNKRRPAAKTKQTNKKTPWYSSECKSAKWSLNRAVKALRKNPFDMGSKQAFYSAKKRFNKICRDKEKRFRFKIVDKLLSIEDKNPSEFWNLVKTMKNYGSNKADSSGNI